MIKNKVEFGDHLKECIDLFNNSQKQSSDAWSEDEYKEVRKTIKDHYLKEQNYTCFFCKQHNNVKHGRAWDTEHLISRTAYPQFMFEPQNLCITCIDCNQEKGAKNVLLRRVKTFPKKSSRYKIAHPHFDKYDDH